MTAAGESSVTATTTDCASHSALVIEPAVTNVAPDVTDEELRIVVNETDSIDLLRLQQSADRKQLARLDQMRTEILDRLVHIDRRIAERDQLALNLETDQT